MPIMMNVYSSNVNKVGHDPDKQELHVEWGNGKVSVYTGVPAQVAEDVRNSWSVGKAIQEQIKDKFPHRYDGGGS